MKKKRNVNPAGKEQVGLTGRNTNKNAGGLGQSRNAIEPHGRGYHKAGDAIVGAGVRKGRGHAGRPAGGVQALLLLRCRGQDLGC